MKRNHLLLLTANTAIMMILLSASSVYAESVFLKNGSIVEGKIKKETDKSIQLSLPDGSTREISRKDIIRTLYHENYKTRRYLTKMDGVMLEVYIVDEDNSSYTYRTDLNSPNEVKILKDEVDSISRREVKKETGPEKQLTRRENIINRASLVRLGLAGYSRMGDSELSGMYHDNKIPIGYGLLLDFFVWRQRDTIGNGFDFFTRLRVMSYKFDESKSAGFLDIAGNSGDTLDNDNNDGVTYFSPGAGARYIYGFYFLGLLSQGYVSVAYQYLAGQTKYGIFRNGSMSEQEEIATSYKSPYGIVGALGIEVGFSPNAGAFAEISYGYSPADVWGKKRNLEGISLYYGVTLRTLSAD